MICEEKLAARIIIVTGGTTDNALIQNIISDDKDAYIIGVDKGLNSLHELKIKPDLVVGDFDSVDDGIRAIYAGSPDAIILNPKKDFTDTHVAVLEALKRNPQRITILGATGTRIDHMLGNIALLKVCLDEKVEAEIVDLNNRIRMIDKQLKIRRNEQYGHYISCMPFTEKVTGISIKGFEYNLEDATIIKEQTIGISNELREEEGLITIKEGRLIVIEAKD